MSVPKIYRSTDTDAPVFIPNDTTTWQALLKQCLVYGYTDRDPAGWSIAYEDDVAQTLVLKQGGGNQRYLWLGSPGLIGASGNTQSIRYLTVQSYLYMTDINTGTGMFPGVANTNIWSFANQQNSGSAVAQDWTIVATDKFFLVYLNPTSAWSGDGYKPKIIYFFGDFKSNVTNDTYNTILSGYGTSTNGGYTCCFSDNALSDMSPFTWSEGSTTSPNSGAWMAGPFYQQLGFPTSPRFYPENYIAAGQYPGNGQNYFPDFCSNELNLSKIRVQEFWSGKMSARGTLPGIWLSCFSPEHPDGTIVAGTGDLTGSSFFVLNSPINNYTWPVLYIQLDSWDD